MKLIKKALLGMALAASLGSAATANAAVLTDVYGPTLVVLDANGFLGLPKSYTYTHTITDNGFNSPADSINSAFLNLTFLDAILSESWKVKIGLDQTATGGNLQNFSFTNIALGLTGSSILDLLDGSITTTITATSGSFSFVESLLTVDYTPNGRVTPPNNVPEPATLAIMGMGLLGLMAARRRKQ